MNRLFVILLITLTLMGCERNPTPATETAVEHAQKHFDAKYVCPMHPSVVRDQPGSCPICGMTLVRKESGPGEREVAYWQHPHDPTITSPEPRKDAMGMDYVPVYRTAGGGAEIQLDPGTVQKLGVRTAAVERGRLWRRIDTVGYVTYAGGDLTRVRTRVPGWVREVRVSAVGDRVAAGATLFTLFSPELVTAQSELVQALALGDAALSAAARTRLASLGMDARSIARVARERTVMEAVPVVAPRAGVVAALGVRAGEYLMPDSEALTLGDTGQLWVEAEVFPAQAAWLRVGMPVEVRSAYDPGAPVLETEVEYVYPQVDPVTRTAKARIALRGADATGFLADMYVDVTLFGGAKPDVLSVPRQAVIRIGDGARVIVALGDGRFAPRAVRTGLTSGDRVEVLEGLAEGDEVVVRAQFMLDSEASVQAALARLDGETQP